MLSHVPPFRRESAEHRRKARKKTAAARKRAKDERPLKIALLYIKE
jgi:hypothetical protein